MQLFVFTHRSLFSAALRGFKTIERALNQGTRNTGGERKSVGDVRVESMTEEL